MVDKKRLSNIADEDWEERDKLAMFMIQLHLADSICFLVLNFESAKTLWENLLAVVSHDLILLECEFLHDYFCTRLRHEQIINHISA